MNKEVQSTGSHLAQLTDDARDLLAATAGVAGEKVGEIRKRLAATLEINPNGYSRVRGKATAGARAVDRTVRAHPYEAMGIAFSVGAALIGYLIARQCSPSRD